MKIEDIILSIIQSDKQVYINGLGVLSIEKLPVFLDPITNSFIPPRLAIVFSPIEKSDKTLINVLSQKMGISVQDAERTIAIFVDNITKSLNSKDYAIIEGVCLIKKEISSWHSVTILNNAIFDKNNFGLTDFKATTINKQTIAAEIISTEKIIEENNYSNSYQNRDNISNKTEVIYEKEPKSSKYGYLWFVFLFFILAGGGVLGYIFKEDVIEFVKGKEKVPVIVIDSTKIIKDTTTEIIPIDTTTIEIINTDSIEKAEKKKKKRSKSSDEESYNYGTSSYSKVTLVYAIKDDKFYVIGGSYSDIANVFSSVDLLMKRGFEPVVVPKISEGNYYVAYKSGFKTREEAQSYLDLLIKTESNVPWIIKF